MACLCESTNEASPGKGHACVSQGVVGHVCGEPRVVGHACREEPSEAILDLPFQSPPVLLCTNVHITG